MNKRMKGEQYVDDLLDYAEPYIPSMRKTIKKHHKKNKTEVFKPKRTTIEQFKYKWINPIEAFNNVLRCYNVYNFESNAYFQCISFILQSQDEQVIIPAGQQIDVVTNYYFGDFKLRKHNIKREQSFDKLQNMLRYYITNDIVSDKHVRTIFKSGCISELTDKPVQVTIMNNSVQDYNISKGTIVAKIFIYTEENE